MQVQEGQVILVGNERITEILPAEEAGKRNLKASGYEEIDLQGKYILPGLINMHVHLAGNGKPQKKQRDNEALVKKIMSNGLTKAIAYHMVCGFAKDELYSGVTTIRTVIPDCGMTLPQAKSQGPESSQRTKASLSPADIWPAPWQSRQAASKKLCSIWKLPKHRRWIW